jgi:TonB family protein
MLSMLRLLLCAATFWGLCAGLVDASPAVAAGDAEVYLNQVERRIMSMWSLPANSRGVKVVLRMDLEKSGRVSDVRVEKSSGDEKFDASAIQAVRRASPFPPPPKSFPIGDLRMVLDPTCRCRQRKGRRIRRLPHSNSGHSRRLVRLFLFYHPSFNNRGKAGLPILIVAGIRKRH